MTRPRRIAAGVLGAIVLFLFSDKFLPGPANSPAPDLGAGAVAEIVPKLPARNAGRFGAPGDP
ncbi:MAG: hypothetical protein HY925_12860, partial [Elusimicrobia bacterium]|nr:hypothetical protein [Elusimicrobiota bacterium]